MELMQWLTGTLTGEFTLTMLVSMIPVVELRGGIPFGVAAGLPVWAALAAAFLGNILPAPFIIVYIRRIFHWMRERMPWFKRLVDFFEQKARAKGRLVEQFKYLGLFILVAIPLPGTGAWTGSLVAAFLDMPLRRAMPSIAAGVAAAGLIVSVVTYGVSSLI